MKALAEGMLAALAFTVTTLLLLWLFNAAIFIECGPNQFMAE